MIQTLRSEFTTRCVRTLERIGDEASSAGKQNRALAAYSSALSLSPSIPNAVLTKWTNTFLIGGSADEALSMAAKVASHVSSNIYG